MHDYSEAHTERYPDIEYDLRQMLDGLRDLGVTVSREMLLKRANRLLKKWHPGESFKFSNSWFAGFQRRMHVSLRCETKVAQISPQDLQNRANSFLCFIRRMSINRDVLPFMVDTPSQPGKLRCMISLSAPISRFEKRLIVNMDETPLPFEIYSTRTYTAKGSRTVTIKTNRNGWNKRQCTLVLWISADGDIFATMLVFHGEGNIRAKEEHRYDADVRVEFNSKAWNNSKLLLKQLNEDIAPRFDGKATLLVLDHARFHKTDEVRQKIKDINSTLGMVPAGCTPVLQPLDVSINKVAKHYIADAIDILEEEQLDQEWTASERRILITKAVGIMVRRMRTKRGIEIIQRSFQCTGISVSPDGSEDDRISLKDAPNWSFEGWRDNARQYAIQQVKEEAFEEDDVAAIELNTLAMDDASLRIYFSNFTVKRLKVICKMRSIAGRSVIYKNEKKAGIIGALVQDLMRVREQGQQKETAIEIYEDSDAVVEGEIDSDDE